MCSLTIVASTRACVLLLFNVVSRMCSPTIECVLLLYNVVSHYRMTSLTVEYVLSLHHVFITIVAA
jgi:hypothetical protein